MHDYRGRAAPRNEKSTDMTKALEIISRYSKIVERLIACREGQERHGCKLPYLEINDGREQKANRTCKIRRYIHRFACMILFHGDQSIDANVGKLRTLWLQ